MAPLTISLMILKPILSEFCHNESFYIFLCVTRDVYSSSQVLFRGNMFLMNKLKYEKNIVFILNMMEEQNTKLG